MIWVQSLLFFILGAAVTGFLVMLIFPLVWRRALFLANKAVRMEIPVSLNEVEVERDFLRAEHASAVARLEELLNLSESRYAQVLLNYSKMRERNFYLLPFEQISYDLSNQNKQLLSEIATLKADINVANRLLREQAVLKDQLTKLETPHQEALFSYKDLKCKAPKQQQILDDINPNGFNMNNNERVDQEINALKLKIAGLIDQNADLRRTHDNALDILRGQIKIMAAMLVANVALSEGEDSPILQLIEKAENPDSLAFLIKENVTSISSKTA